MLRFGLIVKRGPSVRPQASEAGLDVSVKDASVCIADDTGKIHREVKVGRLSRQLNGKPKRKYDVSRAYPHAPAATLLAVADVRFDYLADTLSECFDRVSGNGSDIEWLDKPCGSRRERHAKSRSSRVPEQA